MRSLSSSRDRLIGRGFATRVAAAILASSPATAAPSPLADLAAGRTAAAPELAGLALVVAGPRGVVRREAHGRAVIDPADPTRERPMTVDTPVRVASVAKIVTAIGVMRLVEAGTLDLDRDVSAYLGWRLRHPAYPDAPVTLRQLLSHTSGLDDASGYSFPLGTTLRDGLTPDHWSAAPGARFSYANINYGIVTSVMEAATATRFDRLMSRLVFAPLGLDACFNWSGCSSAAVARAAALYRKGRDETAWDAGGPWVAQIDDLRGVAPACPVRTAPGAACDLAAYRPGDNGTLFSPQGGLRIGVRDLSKLGRLLLGRGAVDGVRLLRPASVRAMLAPQWRDGPSGETYHGQMRCWGLGVQCLVGGAGQGDQPVAGRTLRWHGHLGEAYGLYSGLWIDPARRRVYAYAITGTAADPARYPGRTSAFPAFEEAVLRDLAASR